MQTIKRRIGIFMHQFDGFMPQTDSPGGGTAQYTVNGNA